MYNRSGGNMNQELTFVIDIDDTLLLYPRKHFIEVFDKYKSAEPNFEMIKTVNQLFKAGHIIILHTGRNWDKYTMTKQQLLDFDISYHELVMGKPQGIYIDKDSYKSIKEYFEDV
jgi:hydroxymethylpyrimidine pyrophosphatase-like HAD family hydrolase